MVKFAPSSFHSNIATGYFKLFLYTKIIMVQNDLAYIPAFNGSYQVPLERFFPPLPRGVFADWLSANTKPGDIILDPLGAHPMVALEAAQNSRQIVFARNNPIIWLLLETLASAPSEQKINFLVSKLLLSRQMDETFEIHLKSVYETTCTECRNIIQPNGFIWEEKADYPTSKVYSCPFCGDSGERPATEQDRANLEKLGNISIHRTRAFQRVLLGGDYEKQSIEDALDCYLPRSLYVVMLLVNRLAGLILEKEDRKLLQAILLSVFDDATSLWHWPVKDYRYLKLRVPPRFLEKNLWLSLENASNFWKTASSPVPVCYWPKLAQKSGGICLYPRNLTQSKVLFKDEKPTAIISIFPRPNQAFWTLSALWSGWLWGQKGATPMRSALIRRHYNWLWFAQAINSTFSPFSKSCKTRIKIYGLVSQVAPNFFFGLQCGMQMAGFTLAGSAYRPADDVIQCEWEAPWPQVTIQVYDLRELISDFLNSRGEPAHFTEILLHCLSEISIANGIPIDEPALSESVFSQIQKSISELLQDDRFAQSIKSNLTGGSLWWLNDPKNYLPPLSEQVELFIRTLLLNEKPVNARELERMVCNKFKGCMTPSAELIHLCLESYSDPLSEDINYYLLEPDERLFKRKLDLDEIRTILNDCASRLGFAQVDGDSPEELLWLKPDKTLSHRYYLTSTCAIAGIIFSALEENEAIKVIIFPGSRSRLLNYRLSHDPRLEAAKENNWHFTKYRTIRNLSKNLNLTTTSWNNQLDNDQALWNPQSQIPLF